MATDGAEVLKIQVTRAVQDPSVRKDLAVGRQVARSYMSADHAADDLWKAIDGKATHYATRLTPQELSQISLALDSTETLSHVLCPEVAASFRDRYKASGTRGFKDIWLVGPTADFTYQLAP
jgi:hypothetical protein